MSKNRPSTRPPLAGPPTPTSPFPLKLRGPVIKGFGRGSADLGIPTANIPLSGLSVGGNEELESGIYYGFASLDLSTVPKNGEDNKEEQGDAEEKKGSSSSKSKNFAVADLEGTATPTGETKESKSKIYPAVLSLGYNPFYANTHRSIEIHLLHSFAADFYGATLSLVILGYIRPEYDYVSKEALVEDIREDIRIAGRSLERDGYKGFEADAWLLGGQEGVVVDGEGGSVVPKEAVL